MTRLQADILLLMAAFIWGTAFVAQKTAFDHLGAFSYTAARFALSTLLVFPLALWEKRQQGPQATLLRHAKKKDLVLVCLVFSFAVIAQQIGLAYTTIASAAFLTGIYVLFVPVIACIAYREKLSGWIFPAALLSVAGVWLLSHGQALAQGFGRGELLVLLCSFGFAAQVVLVGRIMSATGAAFRLSCLQYAAITLAGTIGAVLFEHPALSDFIAAWKPIAYAGILSGGIAYTAQVVAQRNTPASDSAIILSAESVFAALAGALFMKEEMSPEGVAGCALIVAAILMVEFLPALHRRLRARKPAPL
ncbi:MAG: EamA family transporter [Alphaproteobacteria bacterium]|nr:EamA family transporter [Alphaproteobacteria bacterium]